ncbi:MAG: hypothetical protein OEW30_09285 [Acidimicrobiia bacterium]|nr:hypothetical protein [Acidimicrobiia bacterium]
MRLSEITALEARDRGISVFSIDPGAVQTPMLDSILESDDMGTRAPQIATVFHEMIDGGATRPPEDAARLVVSLASGEADALYCCYLGVDDDLVELMSRADEIRERGCYTLRIRM